MQNACNHTWPLVRLISVSYYYYYSRPHVLNRERSDVDSRAQLVDIPLSNMVNEREGCWFQTVLVALRSGGRELQELRLGRGSPLRLKGQEAPG